MKETTFGQRFIAKLPEVCPRGWKLKVVGHSKQRSDIPDWLLCLDGRFAGIEFKIQRSGKISSTPGQANELNLIRKAGGRGYLIAYCEQSGEILIQHNKSLSIIFADYIEVKWEKSFSSIQNACKFIVEDLWTES